MIKIIGIYKVTSPSGKVYIGQSWDIQRRWIDHKKSKQEKSRKLYSSFKSHGVENHVFEVIHELPVDVEQEVLDRYEQLYMDAYRDGGVELLNIREGGSRGKHTEETKILFKTVLKGKFQEGHTINRGRKHTDETKRKHSKISLIINSDPVYKEKMRNSILNSEAHKAYREQLKGKPKK